MKAFTMPTMRRKNGGVRCGRCDGLMVREYVVDLDERCWKCVVCGERMDPLILAHREVEAMVMGSPGSPKSKTSVL